MTRLIATVALLLVICLLLPVLAELAKHTVPVLLGLLLLLGIVKLALPPARRR